MLTDIGDITLVAEPALAVHRLYNVQQRDFTRCFCCMCSIPLLWPFLGPALCCRERAFRRRWASLALQAYTCPLIAAEDNSVRNNRVGRATKCWRAAGTHQPNAQAVSRLERNIDHFEVLRGFRFRSTPRTSSRPVRAKACTRPPIAKPATCSMLPHVRRIIARR